MSISALVSTYTSAVFAGRSPSAVATSAAHASDDASTVVHLSAQGRQAVEPATRQPASLFDTDQLLLPSRANVATLTEKAGQLVGARLDALGIARNPAFDLVIEDVNSPHVTVKGNRPDARAIEEAINGDPAIQMAVHNAHALASHVPGLERAAAFSREYANAGSQAEADRLISRYADLFSQSMPPAVIDFSFGEGGLMIAINGATVHG
ncbi:hypothetical protein [Nitrogeniibacter aestuarii]|uniref:hypothetical protein n=1 Tax=Nitrogeniibacter aestuarii TaxID=2815343 RepID=UPI001D0FDAEF|nr:hypothetical protein [Nitrogeniibacter aestuarii]